MTKLFISYAHLDSGIVLNISRQLQEEGYEMWIDTLGIQGGNLWVTEIVKGIRGCDIFLLFVSSSSVQSQYVRRELDVAFGENKKIIHVLIENVEIPDGWVYQLAGLQYIDYQNPGWKHGLLEALGESKPLPPQPPSNATGKLNNPYSSLPVLELVERSLIFSNRDKELQNGIEHLKKHRLLLVTGMPGIGKSTFARALLDSRPADSPEPFWYNFERHRSSGNTLSVLLDRISGHLEIGLKMEVRQEVMAFRDSPGGNASVNDVDVLIGFLNQEKPIWLVFDNLETVLSGETNGFLDDGLEVLFDSLKNNTHNANIIITNPFVPVQKNGEPFLEAGTKPLTLDGLDDASAMAFLCAYGVQDISERELALLIRETNGHPFVLNYVARYIQAIGTLAAGENLQEGLEEITQRFGDSLKQRLTLQEFTALQSLTILNREISLTGLRQVAQIQTGLVVRLREMGLLQTNDAGKFWLHNIVRNSLKPTDENVSKQMHLRAMNFYQTQTQPSTHQTIDDYASILEWHYHAVEAGDIISACSAIYSTGLEEQLMKWNEYDLLALLCEQVLVVIYSEKNDLSNVNWVKIQHTLGIVYFYLGNFKKSITYLQSALNSLPPEEGDELRVRLLVDLSESYNNNREFQLAMDLCEKALVLLANKGDSLLQARVLNLRGIIYRDQGNLEQAATDLGGALRLYEEKNDQVHIANVTGDLGIVFYFQNLFDEAVSCYRQAIASCEAINDLRGAIIGYFYIGDIFLLDGKYAMAREELEKALELARKKKMTWMEVDAGLYLVEALAALLEFDQAEENLHALKPALLKQASPCSFGRELALLGWLSWKRNQPEQAKIHYEHAFELLESPDCKYECARAYIPFAKFMKEQGELDIAEKALQMGRRIFSDLNNQMELKIVNDALSEIHKQSN